MKVLKYDLDNVKSISGKLFGLFFEDINFSIDGGINSNQLNNARFNFRFRKVVKNFYYRFRRIGKCRRRISYREIPDYFRYWHTEGAITVTEQTSGGIGGRQKSFPLLTLKGAGTLYNLGYNGGRGKENSGRYFRDHSTEGAIGIKAGHIYECSFYIKNISYKGAARAYAEYGGGALTEKADFLTQPGDWLQIKLNMKGLQTGIGKFVLEFDGTGGLCLDNFYFGDTDSLGAGNPMWSAGRMRQDLVQAMKELNPKFVRFPGGCIVEGYSTLNSYYWKNTVGPLLDRKPTINLWGEAQYDGAYMQSYEIGFYEYFLLCEYLNAEPLPIINAGLACQGRTVEHYKAGEPEFKRYIDDAVDLVEFANGDPETNKWAQLRADSGHPKPFNLKMLGIGNENWGEDYMKNFAAIKAAVKEKMPDIEIIWSAGFDCYKHKNYDKTREGFDGVHDDCIVDDHFYREPAWLLENAGLYDDYSKKARIFLGEYAANSPWDEKALPNNYYSALAEAAFMTNLERNGDKVVMSSYAPLFSRVGGEQWKHNLINFNSLYTLKTANYYVQQMYADNTGPYYVPCDTISGEGLYHSAATDGKFLYIKLVNLGNAPCAVSINLKNRPINGKAEVYFISSKDDYARNNLDYGGEPQEYIKPILSEIQFASGNGDITLPERAFCVIKIAQSIKETV